MERAHTRVVHGLARAARQLNEVGRAWDARLNRIKRIAEEIQRKQAGAEGTTRDS